MQTDEIEFVAAGDLFGKRRLDCRRRNVATVVRLRFVTDHLTAIVILQAHSCAGLFPGENGDKWLAGCKIRVFRLTIHVDQRPRNWPRYADAHPQSVRCVLYADGRVQVG